jgi:hypothetical protein
MTHKSATIVSPVEAARRIYNAASPTPEQVGRVVKKIEAGVLARSERGGLTTTLEAVADYMARREAGRGQGARHATELIRKAAGEDVADPQQHHLQTAAGQRSAVGAPLSAVYRELMKDYFLAVLLRRRMAHRSETFHWIVNGSQAVLLTAVIVLAAMVSVGAIRATILPPDHRAIHAWVADRHDDVKVVKIVPLAEPVGSYRVEYNYVISGQRRIYTSMILTLENHQVVRFTSEL